MQFFSDIKTERYRVINIIVKSNTYRGQIIGVRYKGVQGSLVFGTILIRINTIQRSMSTFCLFDSNEDMNLL